MTVFDCEEVSSATKTAKKGGDCMCAEMDSCWTLKELSTGFSYRLSTGDCLCENSGDVFCDEDETKNSEGERGTTLEHDHCYTKCPERSKVSSASESSELDESLQNLFETCEIDREFLAEAKPAFPQFLDDVLDSSDVPAADDLFFFDLEDCSSCRVPTKSSVCLSSPPASPCLFTSAGSTDTVLSASVAGFRSAMTSLSTQMASQSPVPLFDCSSASSSFVDSSAVKLRDLTPPSVSDPAALDNKLKDVIEFLFNENSAQQPAQDSDVTSFLKETDDVISCTQAQQPLSFSDDDSFVWPTTMSHRIQNGVCLSCSPPPKQPKTNSVQKATDESPLSVSCSVDSNNTVLAPSTTASALSPQVASTLPSQQNTPSLSSPSTSDSSSTPQQCLSPRKRKTSDTCDSCESDQSSDKRARLDPSSSSPSSSSPLSRPSSSSFSENDSDGKPSSPLELRGCAKLDNECVIPAGELPLPLDLLGDDVKKVGNAQKRSVGVFDYLSFVRANKLPLSPINIHQFGRCG